MRKANDPQYKLTLERQSQTYSNWFTENGHRPLAECEYHLYAGNGTLVDTFCPRAFHKSTGMRLNPGEKQRVKITIKGIKA